MNEIPIEDIPIIPPIKINLKIRNRCKDGFNHRYQYENPFGNKFEQPKQCHSHKDLVKYQCNMLKIEDILKFRSDIYQTNEKSHQNQFISDFLVVSTPKRRYGNSEVARVMTIIYKVPKLNGESLNVCRSMFFAVTGMFEKRIKGITEKLFKKYLIEQGNVDEMFDSGKKRDPFEKREKMKKLLSEKTERILQLEKGTFHVFSKVIIGKKESNLNETKSMSTRSKISVKRKSKRKTRRKKELYENDTSFDENCLSVSEDIMEDDTIPATPKHLLDLESLEICRICLRNEGNLKYLFQTKFVEMYEYCFSIKVSISDNQPKTVCQTCLEHLKISYNFKMCVMESQEIVKSCLNVAENFKTQENYSECETNFDCESQLPSNHTETIKNALIVPSETSSNIKSYQITKCYLCNIDLTDSLESVMNHFKGNHSLIELKKCDKCEFESEYPWFMNLHLQIHADNKRLCVFCGKIFKKGSSHLQNCKEKNSKRQRLFCKYCQAGYWNPHNLKEHERTHTQERPYHCSSCTKSFFRRIHLRKHMLDHGVEPPFKCSFCLKGFLVKNRLTNHESTCCRVLRQPRNTM